MKVDLRTRSGVTLLLYSYVCLGNRFLANAAALRQDHYDSDDHQEPPLLRNLLDINNNESLELAALALKNALNHPSNSKLLVSERNQDTTMNSSVEDIGSSPDGGKLVRLKREGVKKLSSPTEKEIENRADRSSSNTRNLQKKTKSLKNKDAKSALKAGTKSLKKAKKTKMTKKTKAPTTDVETKSPTSAPLDATQAPTQASNDVTDTPTQASPAPTKATDNATNAPTITTSDKANMCTKIVAEEATWATWFGDDDLSNFTPIFKPATDAELRSIVESSKMHGCSVRMMGARHSWDGMVTQRKEEDVVVISLAAHVTEIDGWNDSMNPITSTFRIGAGKSWYDVSALIRPNGFVLNSRSAGAYFSVGGVIANMVHGGGRMAGFMHDDVVKMLVLTSDGNFHEVEGDDLRYWRSSAGQLGMIIAIEMKMHSEAIPQVIGVNPSTGEPIFDEEKGGFVMGREKSEFTAPTNQLSFFQLVQDVASKAYETNAMHDSSQFFFNYYTNTLSEYYTNFSGPRFSGSSGPFPDEAKAAQYRSATEGLVAQFPDVAFEGVPRADYSPEYFCAIFCVPPSGPLGDGSPCISIPSTLEEGKLLCEVPIETAAAVSIFGTDFLDGLWDADSSTSNDGYFIMDLVTSFDSMIAFVPARSLANAFGTWYEVCSQALTGTLSGIDYVPNSSLEFRFIDPKETAVLNPIPPMSEVKAAFNDENEAYFGPEAFDTLFPPLPEGLPDGWIAIELINLKYINDNDFEKFAVAMQQAWSMMGSNPFLPYGDGVVDTCDASNNIFPCQGAPAEGTQCCNPSIPVYMVHLGKGWGYGLNPSTTPTTGKMTPFTDPVAIANMYNTVPSKQSSILSFNAKRAELDADVFSGGAMMRWLDPSVPNTDYEVRKLTNQQCDSPDFMLDPNKECINDSCVDSVCA